MDVVPKPGGGSRSPLTPAQPTATRLVCRQPLLGPFWPVQSPTRAARRRLGCGSRAPAPAHSGPPRPILGTRAEAGAGEERDSGLPWADKHEGLSSLRDCSSHPTQMA